jgi:Rieske 2Fe-2S family protein
MGDLRLGRRIVYDVKANWKLIVLNFNECLHCPNLHPALNRLHHYLGADNVEPTACYCGGAMGFREGVETMSMDGKRRREYLPGLSESQRQQVAYHSVYPNLLLSLHPDYMMTHTLWPRAHDRTEIVCEWHFHPAELARPSFHADDAVEFWDLTNREDWWIAEHARGSTRGCCARAVSNVKRCSGVRRIVRRSGGQARRPAPWLLQHRSIAGRPLTLARSPF